MNEKDRSAMQGEPLEDRDLEAATGGGNYGYYGYRDSQKKLCPRCGAYYFEGKPCACALQRSLGNGKVPDYMRQQPAYPSHSMNDQLQISRIDSPFPD